METTPEEQIKDLKIDLGDMTERRKDLVTEKEELEAENERLEGLVEELEGLLDQRASGTGVKRVLIEAIAELLHQLEHRETVSPEVRAMLDQIEILQRVLEKS